MSDLEKEIHRLTDEEKILLAKKIIRNGIPEKYEHKLFPSQEKELDELLRLTQSGKAVFLAVEEIKSGLCEKIT